MKEIAFILFSFSALSINAQKINKNKVDTLKVILCYRDTATGYWDDADKRFGFAVMGDFLCEIGGRPVFRFLDSTKNPLKENQIAGWIIPPPKNSNVWNDDNPRRLKLKIRKDKYPANTYQ